MTKRWLVSAVSIALLGGGTYFYLQSAAQPELLPTLIVEKGTIENKRWLLVKLSLHTPCLSSHKSTVSSVKFTRKLVKR